MSNFSSREIYPVGNWNLNIFRKTVNALMMKQSLNL